MSPRTFCRSKRWAGRSLLARLRNRSIPGQNGCSSVSPHPQDPPSHRHSLGSSWQEVNLQSWAHVGRVPNNWNLACTLRSFGLTHPPEPGRHFFLMQAVRFHFRLTEVPAPPTLHPWVASWSSKSTSPSCEASGKLPHKQIQTECWPKSAIPSSLAIPVQAYL